MGQARKTPTNGKGRRDQSSSGRRPIAKRANGAGAVVDLPQCELVDAHTSGEGVGDRRLDDPGETNKGSRDRYGGLRLKAEAALEILITAEGVPANVRAAAVRTALELVGAIGGRSKDQRDQEDRADDLDPEQLSIEDIDRAIKETGRV
jgi:hypothetical protein